MAYVEARQYSSATDMLASAKAVRDRLFKTKPRASAVPAPERVFYIEPQKVFAEHNAHITDYLRRKAMLDYLESTEEPVIVNDFVPVEKIKVESIINHCSGYFGVSVIDLKSNRRTRAIVRPRQVAMYLAKTLTLKSLPEIGRRMGGRDHTTVLHGVNKIAALKASDAFVSKAIHDLTAIVCGQVVS